MAALFAYTCACCGERHEGAPSVGFDAPAPWHEQPQPVRDAGWLTADACHYCDVDGAHYFVRGVLEIPIVGVNEPFLWGLWVSLSAASFDHYRDCGDHPPPGTRYVGWLCNYLPGYPSTYALKSAVIPQSNEQRPLIEFADDAHPLVRDWRQGLSPERAQQLAERCLHG